jgi:hypothetical protein
VADEVKRVRVVLEAVGGAQAADDASRFKASIDGLAQAESAAGDETAALRAELERLRTQTANLQQAQTSQQQRQADFSRLAQESTARAIDFTTKLAGAAGAVQSLTGALGVQGGAAGLIASMAASAAASAQLGGTFGPQGALVGGILGAAIPAIAALVDSYEDATERTARLREETDRLRESMMAQRLEADIAGALADPSMAGAILGAVPLETLQQQRDLAAAEAREADMRASQARPFAERRGARLSGSSAAADLAAAEADLRAARERMALIDQEIDRRGALAAAQDRQAAAQSRLTAAQSEHDLAERAAREGGQAADERYAREQEAWERYDDAIRSGLEAQIDATLRAKAANDERNRAALEGYEQWKAAEEERHRLIEASAARSDAANEAFARSSLERLQRDTRERTQQLDRETEKREKELSTFSDLASGVSRSLVTAVSEIASGAKSSEDAFKGMLAAFLAAIAEQALIKAAFEFAEAVASAARQDWGGFGQHLAAGVAFTGVAVATGAAAGAVSAPPGQGQASSPDRVGSSGGDSGGKMTLVNNWNAPQVVAGTEADVGRTLDRLGRRAYQRFGRLAA